MLNFRPHKLLIKRTTGGGYDGNGNPVPVTSTWSEPIPCHYSTESRERIYVYADGTEEHFDYAIWFEPIEENLTAKYVRLIDQYGNIEVDERKVEKCVNRQLRTKLYL